MQTTRKNHTQILLLYLLLTNAFPGIWALFFPHEFYTSFPGFGRQWVAGDGPYNEHLIRDVGAFFCALSTLAALSLRTMQVTTVRFTAYAILVFSVPHFLYHLIHLHRLPTPLDQILNAVTLFLGVLIPVLLLFSARETAARHPVGNQTMIK